MRPRIRISAVLLLLSILTTQTEGFSQSIIPTSFDLADRSMVKLKSNLKNQNKGGRGINVSIAEMKALLSIAESNGANSIFLFVVGMDRRDRNAWGLLNPGMSENDWDEQPALILKYQTSTVAFDPSMRTPAFVNPFSMVFGSGLKLKSVSQYFAIGSLCPPPTNCILD
jgi:hypothetical protein